MRTNRSWLLVVFSLCLHSKASCSGLQPTSTQESLSTTADPNTDLPDFTPSLKVILATSLTVCTPILLIISICLCRFCYRKKEWGLKQIKSQHE
ncbi:hypothetical protein TcWFU_004493 [Taenia crassiceps]|uniref:Uncharacterized protein n=1 Tax=Taenia crassiceps TaxID=6207 RepID=A0ABR4QH08_9CEST